MEERYTELAGLQTSLISDGKAAAIRVVFLHGFDMRASDLTPFAHSLAIPGVAYAFPQGPMRVSATGHAWWESGRLKAQRLPAAARDLWNEFPVGREAARARLGDWLDALRAKHAEPIVLAGFSQGGMLACDSVLMEGTDVCGLGALSSSGIAGTDWVARRDRLNGIPAFVSHGHDDPDLAFTAGQRLAKFLTASGATVDWLPFDGGHEIPFPVWKGFKRFLQLQVRAAQQNNTYVGYTGQDARL
jgi:phospholipase/carboxylesterase